MNKKRINKDNLEIRYANTSVTSAYTSIPIATLETERSRKTGFPFIKRGKTVLYDLDVVDEIMLSLVRSSTSNYN